MEVATADAGGPDQRATPSIRPPFVGLAAGLVWIVAAFVAYQQLGPYPPSHAMLILVGGALWWGFTSWPVSALARSRTVNLVLVAAAAGLPFVLVTWVPGVAQPREHTVPGAPTLVLSAAPDGSFDLYAWPDGDPAKVVPLTDSGGSLYPQLSADETRVAYSVPTANGSDVWMMHLGEDWAVLSQTPLIQDAGTYYPVTWAPDGRLIVEKFDPDGSALLSYADPSTGGLEPLMSGSQLDYSPDRKSIVFCRPHRGDAQGQDIWIADADGSHAHRVIDTGGDDYAPQWAPDGNTIAFTSNQSGSKDVWTATVDGSDLRDVTPQTSDSNDGAWGWSPDGQILFTSDRSHTGGVFIYFMDTDGSNVELALRI